MEPPPGYPPPTLFRKRSRLAALRPVIIILVLLAGVGYLAMTMLLDNEPSPPPPAPVERKEVEAAPVPAVDTVPPEAPQVIVEQPIEEGSATGKARDARKANQWYFVKHLGDGPGAIYSRDGGQWNFALACTTRARTIEFIAVGTGSAGTFTDQQIKVGQFKLMMDAAYSKDGGGTISTTLPASDPFFDALDGGAPMEIQLVADRKTIVPVGPDVVRLIKACRGRG